MQMVKRVLTLAVAASGGAGEHGVMVRIAVIPLAMLLGAAALYVANVGRAQEPSQLPNRAVVPLVAREEFPAPAAVPTVARRTPPPPGEGYCGPSTTGTPPLPNAIFGFLTIGGQPAPAETLVGLTFNGQPGPYEYTRAAGGYRVFYAAGGQGHVPPCINEVGAQMGILVNGILTDANVTVGARQNGGAGEAFQFDVAIP